MSVPIISIQCFTYNHVAYIRQCLDGFIMQQTSYDFEAVVHDDASTDGTAEIVREYAEKYPDIIKPIFEIENQYSKKDGSLQRIMDKHCTGKYLAFCEGDDYWTDPLKLQKQVDYMESHPDCGMTYTDVKKYIHNSGEYQNSWCKQSTFEDMLLGNKVCTLSVCLRMDFYNNYIDEIRPYEKDWKMGDYPLWLFFFANSKPHFIDEVTGVYRVLTNSASHSTSFSQRESFIISSLNMVLFFAEKYNHAHMFPAIAKRFVDICLDNAYVFNKTPSVSLLNVLRKYRVTDVRVYVKSFLYCNTYIRNITKRIRVQTEKWHKHLYGK